MKQLDQLKSIRGFAALYVLIYHAEEAIGGFDFRRWTGFFAKGYLAVDFFFVLSGFILAYVHAMEFESGQGRYRRFLSLRLARIYPVHLLTLFISVAATVPLRGFPVTPLERDTPATLIANIFMVHAWGIFDRMSWNCPSWSISAEWFAYLLYPLFLVLSRPVKQSAAASIVTALTSIMVLGLLSSLLLPPHQNVGQHIWTSHTTLARPFDLTYDWGVLRVALEFLAGVCLWRAFALLHSRRCAWATPGAALTVAAAIIVLHLNWSGDGRVQDPLAVALITLLILFLALGRGIFNRLLEFRPLLYLGDISYTIYMVHGLFIGLYLLLLQFKVLRPTTTFLTGSLVAAIYLALILGSSVLVYEFFERPLRDRIRRMIDAKAQRLVPTAVGG